VLLSLLLALLCTVPTSGSDFIPAHVEVEGEVEVEDEEVGSGDAPGGKGSAGDAKAGLSYFEGRPPIFILWLGEAPIPTLHKGAIESCKRLHGEDFDVQLITDTELAKSTELLGFDLHRSFRYLSPVEQADYLRSELLYHHGGYVFEADIYCLTPLLDNFDKAITQYEASGSASAWQYPPLSKEGQGLAIDNNAMGPFRPKCEFANKWRKLLHHKMAELTPRLEMCGKTHPDGKGGVDHKDEHQQQHIFRTVCGLLWGELIDFVKPAMWAFEETAYFGKNLQMCDTYGQNFNVDAFQANGYFAGAHGGPATCDFVHVGAAHLALDGKELTIAELCDHLPIIAPVACPKQEL